MAIMINTSLGDFVIDLHTELCPLTCKNFLKLCKMKYYNNCLFHLVQKDFIMQTGDPTGTGSGGDSMYKLLYGDQARFFQDEIHPKLKHDKVGTVAMASAGENLNASQFYITARPGIDYLDGKHTIFGEIAEGIDTIMRINEAYVDEKGRPFKNIRVKHTYILDDPFEDPPQLVELIPESSPELKLPKEGEEVRLEDDWVPMDEKQDPEELDRSLRQKEAHSRAVVLEMIGDVPDAEMKPPENVLFICKLNPVTQEEDLEIIFSRFGKVLSADIIRDYKTGDSLCYGFIEFESQEACEAAYFKMDNVLIDDRRIHVDFSQSVAKLWTRFRRFGARDEGEGKPENEGFQLKNSAKPSYELKDTGGQHGGSEQRYELLFGEDNTTEPGRRKASNRASHHTERIALPSNRKSYGDAETHEGRNSSVRSEVHDSSRSYRRTHSGKHERHKYEERKRSQDFREYDGDDTLDKRARDTTTAKSHRLHVHKRARGDRQDDKDYYPKDHSKHKHESHDSRDDGSQRYSSDHHHHTRR
ncbi:hypothetical protein O6H91_04G079400 [Diphasiastrum complanatum]|uniref:Uncharacterized protein n=1 Tax=Diphasiastrum complanatum TaxID=34168 RepID=A0ACC2DYZ4_DIPCM|nr:hypothetical protein O6H91_04G079400 [Diphasiastrum complanatum]